MNFLVRLLGYLGYPVSAEEGLKEEKIGTTKEGDICSRARWRKTFARSGMLFCLLDLQTLPSSLFSRSCLFCRPGLSSFTLKIASLLYCSTPLAASLVTVLWHSADVVSILVKNPISALIVTFVNYTGL